MHKTALQATIKAGSEAIVQILLDKGVDVKDNDYLDENCDICNITMQRSGKLSRFVVVAETFINRKQH